MRLFLKKGYDETTIDEIAAAVEISPSTFFNYFPTKEEVVMLDIYDPMMIALVLNGPKDEPASVTFRRVLDMLAEVLEQDRDLLLTKGRLMLEIPELRARVFEEMERSHDLFASLFAQRIGRDPDDFELRVTVRALIGAIFEASLRWMKGGGRGDLGDLITRALDVVDAGARLDALHRSAVPPGGSARPVAQLAGRRRHRP